MDRTSCTPRALRTAVTVRLVCPQDVLGVGALHIQRMRERGQSPQQGFLDLFADAWLADQDRIGWLAEDPRGKPLAVLHGRIEPVLPTATAGRRRKLRLELMFVTSALRDTGLETRLLSEAGRWAKGNADIDVIAESVGPDMPT
ncbi:MAG: hypothetical protein ACK5MP_02475 [Nostocoides sp.]